MFQTTNQLCILLYGWKKNNNQDAFVSKVETSLEPSMYSASHSKTCGRRCRTSATVKEVVEETMVLLDALRISNM